MTLAPLIQRLQRYSYGPGADAERLFHGRGGCFPGLEHINADWYTPVLMLSLYRELSADDFSELREVLDSVPANVATIAIQQRYIRGAPIELLRGELPANPVAVESGLKFGLSFGDKQNIGFFPDMAPGRQWVRQHCEGRRVLNLFAYTGAFSVVAMAAGAKSVLNVDMSKAALIVARSNHQLNGHDQFLHRDIRMLPYNVFKSWNKIIASGPFDLVVIDPPSRQKGSFVAETDYARVLRKLPQLVSPRADILACLNAPHLDQGFMLELFREYCPGAGFIQRLPDRPDFPEADRDRNLKAMHFRWDCSG